MRVLFRDDLPTAKQISETHAEGKTLDVEPVLICGTAELVRTGQSLSAVSRSVLMAVLAAWWEYSDLYEQTLGDDLGKRLEGEVFTSDEEITEFLTIVIEPRIKAGREHIPGLYQLGHDERYRRAGSRSLGSRHIRMPGWLCKTNCLIFRCSSHHVINSRPLSTSASRR